VASRRPVRHTRTDRRQARSCTGGSGGSGSARRGPCPVLRRRCPAVCTGHRSLKRVLPGSADGPSSTRYAPRISATHRPRRHNRWALRDAPSPALPSPDTACAIALESATPCAGAATALAGLRTRLRHPAGTTLPSPGTAGTQKPPHRR